MISVIIPYYMDTTYLVRCLSSIKRQTYKDIEILLITDECGEIICDSDVSIISVNTNNRYAGINTALQQAKGDYVYFCSVSSILAPNVLETLAGHSEDGWCAANYCIAADAKSFVPMDEPAGTFYGKLYKRSVLKMNNIEFDENAICAELLFNLRYSRCVEEMAVDDDAYVYETDAKVLQTDYAEIKEEELKNILKVMSADDKEEQSVYIKLLEDIFRSLENVSEDILYLTEKYLHSVYSVNYIAACKLVGEWWTAITKISDQAAYRKLISYLKKYENDQDYIGLILMKLGLRKDQYTILRDNTLDNAMFFIQEIHESAQIINGVADGFVRFYYRDGKRFTGLAEDKDIIYYIENGLVNEGYHGLVSNEEGIYAVKGGVVPVELSGLCQIGNVKAVLIEGKVDESLDGFVKLNNQWYVFKNGILDEKFTGLIKNDYGWWYVKNGTIDWSYKGLAKNEYGWFYVNKGTIDQSYNGKASNQYGTWNVVNGAVVV